MQIKQAIILAGGLGTRLRSAVPDLPKSLAPVAGRPFLGHIIDYWRMQGVEEFVFSLGYGHEAIENYLKEFYPTLSYSSAIEEEPLGTGGGIQLALQACHQEHVLVLNGDTIFKVELSALASLHEEKNALATLALKPLQNFDRYGVVELNEEKRIDAFHEKRFYAQGMINGGIYLLNRKRFLHLGLPEKFSFEKDFLEKHISSEHIYGEQQDGYFIDIGVPEDFAKASADLSPTPLDLGQIDNSWTLFLDRDGVINEEKLGEYVKNWDEFIFSSGVLEVFKKLSDRFGRVIIVTNQRGVGRGLMTEAELQSIHFEMQREVEIVGGRIDKIYYCIEKEATCFNRKPNPGMAMQAKADFPELELSKSIMVGNKPSDMSFGRAAGMFTVFVKTTNPQQPFPHPDIDLCFPSLSSFADVIDS